MSNKSVLSSRSLNFIKAHKYTILIACLVLVGLCLILSSAVGEESSETEADDVEIKLKEMCSSVEGVGSCRVMVTYRETERRYGQSESRIVDSVAVVCKGADKVGVRAELTALLSSLFGIGANRIHISKMR